MVPNLGSRVTEYSKKRPVRLDGSWFFCLSSGYAEDPPSSPLDIDSAEIHTNPPDSA